MSHPSAARCRRDSGFPGLPESAPGLSSPCTLLLPPVPGCAAICGDSLAERLDAFFTVARGKVTFAQLVEPLDPGAVDVPERLVVRDRLLLLATREEVIAEAEVGL